MLYDHNGRERQVLKKRRKKEKKGKMEKDTNIHPYYICINWECSFVWKRFRINIIHVISLYYWIEVRQRFVSVNSAVGFSYFSSPSDRTTNGVNCVNRLVFRLHNSNVIYRRDVVVIIVIIIYYYCCCPTTEYKQILLYYYIVCLCPGVGDLFRNNRFFLDSRLFSIFLPLYKNIKSKIFIFNII